MAVLALVGVVLAVSVKLSVHVLGKSKSHVTFQWTYEGKLFINRFQTLAIDIVKLTFFLTQRASIIDCIFRLEKVLVAFDA